MSRLAAGLVALVAGIGLAMELIASIAEDGSLLAALWKLSNYFTILTMVLVIGVFAAIASGKSVSALVVAGTTLSAILVGAVYAILLAGSVDFRGLHLLADRVMHYVVPPLVACWWLGFAPKGQLRWSAPPLIAAYPLAYLAYALVRGSFTHHYAYFFVDLDRFSVAQVAAYCSTIAAAFILFGYAMVWVDRRLGARAPER